MMASFKFKKLWLLSEADQKARVIKLAPGATALVGTNHTGKSTVIRSLFQAFGCQTRPMGGEWPKDVVSAVCFSVGDREFTIVRRGPAFALFDASFNILWATTEGGKLRDNFAGIVEFPLALADNKTGIVRQARPAFFFLPFYVDQDSSWDISWHTFQSLREFRSWEKPTLDIALGVRSSDYWRKAGELAAAEALVKAICQEISVLEGARDRLTERLPHQPWFRDGIAFRRELKQLEERASALAIQQDQLRNSLTRTVSQRDSMIAQVQLIEAALTEHAADMRFLDQRPIGALIECPVCGTPHENSFHARLGLEAEADELRELRRILLKKIVNVEIEHSQEATKLEEVDGQAEAINALLETKRNNISLREIIDCAGADRAIIAFNDQEKHLIENKLAQEKELIEIKDSLKKLDSKKRADDIRKKFNDYYAKFATLLEVPPSLASRKGEITKRPRQGGSGGPRAVLAYYFALSHTAHEFSRGVIPPLVIDSPHQKAQDEINRPMVTEFILKYRVPNQQLILGVEEHLPPSVSMTNDERVVDLSKKYGLLREKDFQEAIGFLAPLLRMITTTIAYDQSK